MKSTSVFLLRENLSHYLNEIVKTETPIVIYRFNKPVAVLMPIKEENIKMNYKKYYGFLGSKKSGKEFEKRTRRNKDERKYIANLYKKVT